MIGEKIELEDKLLKKVGEERNSYFYYGFKYIYILWMHFVDTDITGLER